MIKSQFKDQPDLLDNGIWYDRYDGQLHFYATINNKQWKNPPYRERGSNKGLWKQGTWTYQAFPDVHSDYGVGRTIWG